MLAFMLVCSTIMLAQNKTVTGTVTSSDDGQPIPFATVQIKGTSTGAYTDDNGKYSIDAAADAGLMFTTIGFTEQQIPVNGGGVINVSLSQDAGG